MKTCIVIPVYNHPNTIVDVIATLNAYALPCFLINDGSSGPCTSVLRKIATEQKNRVTLYERPCNGGKGAAVMDGLRLAIEQGFTHAIQVDADGQHNLADVAQLLAESKKNPAKLILGQPRYDASVPKNRLYGRQFTNLWIGINTLSFAIADGMCGFRCYPLVAVDNVMRNCQLGQRMDFDIDIVVRLYWQGVDVVNMETTVQYPLDGVSHFKMWEDNRLISKKHAQLFFGMLWRIPRLLLRHWQ